ncbi:tyrosine-protein phosphatase [Amphritea balenae]|uniref:protein-tyrosine-phosphatase n=1 Tax=Amphritea balenae TaxID=452629 RepID=A0A3P1SSX6_9GAMM|nr:CpsB/CapC family capsule biosynthesis tyrosine phosphatase [Amphritea balenae]RRD00160.1 capsular biosynthesis protein [Amphritea balenae]GGK77164.1 tyrosine protein phosphatase [Amphritea balenae]
MIDLHNHILPGIDDGPATLLESLELARIAVDDGIQHIVATPHIHPGRYENQISNIQPVLLKLQQSLIELDIPLTLSMGAEVRISTEMLNMIPARKIPFIGNWFGQSILLLEQPHSHILPGTLKLIHWLQSQNITPMIAHPERNKEIMLTPDKLSPFVEAGCLIQLTAMSITGNFGAKAQHCANHILEQDWVTVIATDAHNKNHRPPILSHSFKTVVEMLGLQHATRLFIDNPKIILGQSS